MSSRPFQARLRDTASSVVNYRCGSDDDHAMVADVLRQAAALRYFEKYRQVLERGPSMPVPAATPTGGNRIWLLWFQGVDRAPPIVQACLASVRRHLGGREIVVLDEANLAEHVDLPGHLYDRKRRGQMSNVNFSDVLRAYVLAAHGGTWIDATVYLSAPPPPLFLELPLFCFSRTPPALMGAGSTLASSWFLRAEQGSALAVAVRDLLTEFWRHETRCRHHYYFHLMFALAVRESAACAQLWRAVPFYSNVPPHVLQFELFERFDAARFAEITRMSPVHKLTYYGGPEFKPDKPDTFYRQIIAS